MIHYTRVESKDYGWLVFKVVGAASKDAARQATREYLENPPPAQETYDREPQIYPLFNETELSGRERMVIR